MFDMPEWGVFRVLFIHIPTTVLILAIVPQRPIGLARIHLHREIFWGACLAAADILLVIGFSPPRTPVRVANSAVLCCSRLNWVGILQGWSVIIRPIGRRQVDVDLMPIRKKEAHLP